MAELVVVRHGQARFGAADYDALSDLGLAQARALGAHLAALGWQPDRLICGSLARQRQTLAALAEVMQCTNIAVQHHGGFDEYDFDDMLRCAFPDGLPEGVGRDRRAHFRTLRSVLADWQAGRLAGVAESWPGFCARVEAARIAATAAGARRVLAVSSGGVMARLAQAALGAPDAAMIALNMQIANTAMVRFVFNPRAFHLNAFNTTPHLDRPDRVGMLSYS
ncbi:MAG: histidine phosphatase family protein [Alphaproteobacteria bacterium]|nr:MAG: histidine phosphatase family protein [Alphaproteobacteria bacterium]